MSTAEEPQGRVVVVLNHKDCPPPVWNGHSWECRNHSPAVEVPRVREPTKGKAPMRPVTPPRRRNPHQPPTAPDAILEAVEALKLEVQKLAGEHNMLHERLAEVVAAIEPLLKLGARLEGLETQTTLYFSHVDDNIGHVQRQAGRLLKLEQWANGGEVPAVVLSSTPEPDKKTPAAKKPRK